MIFTAEDTVKKVLYQPSSSAGISLKKTFEKHSLLPNPGVRLKY